MCNCSQTPSTGVYLVTDDNFISFYTSTPQDQLDTLWPKQFGVAAGRKDGDSGFISPDGAASNAVLEPAPVDLLAEPGMNILAPAFRPKLSQGTENDYANFQYNATPSLEVEIESKFELKNNNKLFSSSSSIFP